MKCHVNVTKFCQKNTSAKCNKFHTFRQQLLPPSSGIGNGYSDSFEIVGKLFHLDILRNGFSFPDVKQEVKPHAAVDHALTFHASLHLMYQLNAQTIYDITIVNLHRHVSASQCHLQGVQVKIKTK